MCVYARVCEEYHSFPFTCTSLLAHAITGQILTLAFFTHNAIFIQLLVIGQGGRTFLSLCPQVSMQIEDLQPQDEGRYEVEVVNQGGRVTSGTRILPTYDCSVLQAQETINR